MRYPPLLTCGLVFLCTSIAALAGTPTTIYVAPDGADAPGCGSTWQNTCLTVERGINEATGCSSGPCWVWVKTGTYLQGSSRTDTIDLANGVAVYGGFAGTENPATFDLSTRDFVTNETILTGDIPGTTDDIYHVVRSTSNAVTAVLDGFTITQGDADGSAAERDGAGLYITNGSPIIRNCLIKNNTAADNGGGAYVESNDVSEPASPTFENCVFRDNEAEGDSAVPPHPDIGHGGGICATSLADTLTSLSLINVEFDANEALLRGGGVFASCIDTGDDDCSDG